MGIFKLFFKVTQKAMDSKRAFTPLFLDYFFLFWVMGWRSGEVVATDGDAMTLRTSEWVSVRLHSCFLDADGWQDL